MHGHAVTGGAVPIVVLAGGKRAFPAQMAEIDAGYHRQDEVYRV
jgi:hypothetical protein